MHKRGMSPSDLARHVYGNHINVQGYSVARNRDRIGSYLAGQSYPHQETVDKMAKVLRVRPEALSRNPEPIFEVDFEVAPAEEADEPEFVMTALPNGMAKIKLRMELIMPMPDALALMKLPGMTGAQ